MNKDHGQPESQSHISYFLLIIIHRSDPQRAQLNNYYYLKHTGIEKWNENNSYTSNFGIAPE